MDGPDKNYPRENSLASVKATSGHLSSDSSGEVNEELLEEQRKSLIQELGLPEACDWDEIHDFQLEMRRKKYTIDLSLPESSSWDDIVSVISENERIDLARELGLPKETSWGKIKDVQREAERRSFAARYGLNQKASWDKIYAAWKWHWKFWPRGALIITPLPGFIIGISVIYRGYCRTRTLRCEMMRKLSVT
jgi:hypothetical protein